MKIVILGCGRVGATIATTMAREGHSITIIDRNADSFRRLGNDFVGETVVGNGLSGDTLKRAGVEQADAFVAVTNGDNRNIMSVQLAKVRFKVPKVVARIYDPIRAYAYSELGIDTVCTTCVSSGVMHDKIIGREYGSVDEYCRFGMDETPEVTND
ncbi:MAG: TrkA family potassium uptake protein [Armatimonadota bacterium]|nr:TrkA family potassium uptake protein [bacterium]